MTEEIRKHTPLTSTNKTKPVDKKPLTTFSTFIDSEPILTPIVTQKKEPIVTPIVTPIKLFKDVQRPQTFSTVKIPSKTFEAFKRIAKAHNIKQHGKLISIVLNDWLKKNDL